MKFLGVGLPELIILLVVLGPIIATIAVLKWTRKRDSQQSLSLENPPSPADLPPVITNWKTSIGFSILGFFIAWLILTAIDLAIVFIVSMSLKGAVSVLGSRITAMGAYSAQGIMAVFQIAYALFVYPSFFTQKPLLKSNKLISAANLCFGNIIFGCLWNHNLSRSKSLGKSEKGVSYGVYAAISAVTVCMAIFSFAAVQLPMMQAAKTYYETAAIHNNATKNSTPEATTFSDKETGISFTIPTGWENTTKDHSIEDAVCVLEPKDGDGSVMIGVIVTDIFSELSAEELQFIKENGGSPEMFDTDYLDEDYVLSYTESMLSTVKKSSAKQKTIGGNKYWATTASGTMADSGIEMDTTLAYYFNMEKGVSREFALISFNQQDSVNQELESTLRTLVESVRYK